MEESKISEYSYMKTIRFNLIDDEKKSLKKINEKEITSNEKDELKEIMNNFFKNYNNSIKNFKEIFFEKSKNAEFKKITENGIEKFIIYKSIKIKKPWFKIYFKDGWNFKDNKEKNKNETLKKINESFNLFESKINELKQDFIYNSNIEHNKKRNSHFSKILQEIMTKNCFYSILGLVQYFESKSSVEIINLQKDFENIEKDLKSISRYFLSSQSLGVEILRGSFNYYTLNKNSKRYLDEIEKKIIQLKIQKEQKIFEFSSEKLFFRKFGSSKELVLEKLTNNDLDIIENLKKELKLESPLSLEDSKNFLKLFKANLKSDLFKDCQIKSEESKEVTKIFEDIKKYSCLFNFEEKLEKIFNLTREIQKENKEKNKDKNKIQKLKKERGENLKSFSNWKIFITKYKLISQELGRLNIDIKNYEKEQLDCQKINHWNLFLVKENKTYVLFIPNEKRKEVREIIENSNAEYNNNDKIIMIKSLTKRALHKLCFNEYGSFYVEHSIEFKNKIQNIKTKLDPKEKENETLKILKEVLQSDYAKSRLDLKDFDLENSNIYDSKTLDEFEEKLEKKCYKILSFGVDDDILYNLEINYGVFKCEINSYDLDERFLDENLTFKSSDKRHTKEYWNEFWEKLENSNVRLNPEIKVNFKEKDTLLEYYLKNNKNVTDKIIESSHYCYNRNLNDKFIITFSFLKNSGKKYLDLGFADFDEVKTHIIDFNSNINKNLKDSFYCGIDIGEVELASLVVCKFETNKTYSINDKNILSPILSINSNITCLKLKCEYLTKFKKPSDKKLNYKKFEEKGEEIKERQIISNISYFDDRVEFFEEISPFGLDLTCAKVINGKIIENADVLTYLQYLKKLAKRRLFDVYSKGFIEEKRGIKYYFNDLIIDWEFEKNSENYKTNNLVLKLNNKKIESSNAKIFIFIYKYEGIQTKNGIYEYNVMKEYFNDYLNNLKKIKEINSDEYSDKYMQIPMINHLRDALVSNMVGVLSLLREKLGNLYIVLENEKDKNEDDKYIIKRLELALYQKFQTFGLVPPQIKNLMKIRENFSIESNSKKDIQIGNIIFVNSEKTSRICPYCENIVTNHHINGFFNCSKCEFKTNENYKIEEFKFLKSNDSVASYNICKKGFKFINNK